MNELVVKTINFNGDNLLAVKDKSGKINVAVYYVCKGLRLDKNQTKAQRDKINSDIVLSKGGRKISIPTNGGLQEVLCLELDFLPLWLAKINANIISNPESQDKLIEYQLKAKDVLAQAFLENKPALPSNFAEACRMLADEWEEKQKLLPKAQGYDYLMNAEGTVTIGEAANLINIKGIGQNKFFKLLVAEEIIYKKGNSYLPYSEFREHFIVKQNPVRIGDKLENRSQLYLDMAGLDWLAKLLVKRGYEVNYVQEKALVKA
jgi:anti-repressor protein